MRFNDLQPVPNQAGLSGLSKASEIVKQLDLPSYLESIRRALLVSEVADLLMISPRLVYKLAAEQQIPSMRILGCIRFDGAKLAIWLRKISGGPQ